MPNGLYVYGIIQTSEPREFGQIGIGNGADSHVLTRGFRDIAAVVSHSPLMVYDSLSKEKVIRDLAMHERVVERVMSRFTVLPVKFGTMVEAEDQLLEFLEKGYARLRNELKKAEGKVELDVVATWEVPEILAMLARRNEHVRETQQRIAARGEQVSVEEKMMLGQVIGQALQNERKRCQQLIVQDLKQEVTDMCLHDLASDEMIFNAAFLLEKQQQRAFDNTVHALDQKLENVVYFRVVGPLPPYSFSTVLFKKLNLGAIEEAKKTLGLTGELTDEALRDAYYRLAKEYHPDKTGEETSAEFQAIQDAHRILRNFMEDGLLHTEIYRWKEDVQWAG
jgi:hypothetical protein